MRLGVNIDHIATLREARRINEPEPLEAIAYLRNAGANQITIHLREDRRHIDDVDVAKIIECSPLPVNVESSIQPDIIEYLCSLRPHSITLVPEKREEITTEGGLNLKVKTDQIAKIIQIIKQADILPSLFIDPHSEMLQLAKQIQCPKVEFHTGRYANLFLMLHSNLALTKHSIREFELSRQELHTLLTQEIKNLAQMAREAKDIGLFVAAGHGLNKENLKPIISIAEIQELNIGHSIISRAVFVGLQRATEEIIEQFKYPKFY
ncbi:pyridoxine 5'-phosphate synthase [Helicobacter monodelphidis]|uniref:pyridoxine 5'-phosphate synthase n=1 Tax=Helicobacter sp. 15-1451 TaxID=2004995 RepID=UPI000DCD3FCF|nr:pyridoxine 5'-phosphate synthase [Helicobacter sp. 15-1451]RAX57173.1 pyridoxine 5'-phosphate synthase [Helicobacter sp. 15-1451]